MTTLAVAAPQLDTVRILGLTFRDRDIITMLTAIALGFVCNEVRRIHVIWISIIVGLIWIAQGYFPL